MHAPLSLQTFWFAVVASAPPTHVIFYFALGSAAVQLLLRSSRLPFPGQSASFSCSGSGTIIRWEKDNTVLNLTNARYSSDQKMSSLVIHSLVKTDTGLYRCVAVVSGIEESDTVYLSVLGKRAA